MEDVKSKNPDKVYHNKETVEALKGVNISCTHEYMPEYSNVNGKIKGRSLFLGAVLAILFSAINGYLSINFGMSFGYGAFAIIIAYSLFHKLGGGSCKKELSFVLIASSSSMAVYQILAFVLYMLETDTNVSFPSWIAPPKEIVMLRSLDFQYWITPITFLIFTVVLTVIVGLIFTSALKNEFVKSKRMIWPHEAASASLVDACMEGGGSAKLVGVSALIGFAVTFLQYLPLFWGFDFTSLNLSPYLPEGFVFAISLSVAFASIGYIINVNTSLSLMATGLITYLVISPFLVSEGIVNYSPDLMVFYNDLLFKFSISPALGVLLLGGMLLSLLMLVKGKFSKASENRNPVNDENLGYVNLFKILVKGLISNKKYLLTLLSIAGVLFALAWFLNPFSPIPRVFSLLVTVYAFFFGSFVELVLITKMGGETGMSMGMMSMFLYDFPIFGLGYRDYTGYWASPYFRPNPWVSNGILPYVKYGKQFDVSWKDIMKAKIVGWVPTLFFSVIFTIILWKFVGFGTPMMPAVSLLQNQVYLKMLATGNIVGILNPWTFIAGGVLGAMLEVFTPVSMMGIAIGMLLPPHYIVPFGLGGIIRWYTDKKYGKNFYDEKGRLIVTGLMASSLIVQVIMTILINIV